MKFHEILLNLPFSNLFYKIYVFKNLTISLTCSYFIKELFVAES